jgi:hypothetical protein
MRRRRELIAAVALAATATATHIYVRKATNASESDGGYCSLQWPGKSKQFPPCEE